MADGSQQQSRRFSAFVSYNYNSRDTAFAKWLHKRLETYRLPRKLLNDGREAALQGGRLRPLFRDADEMTAAADLSQAIREALAKSDFLIVICSPEAARSKWVGLEIELFRALHGDRNILAALVDGKPDTAFHPALLGGVNGPVQPLAADFRASGPGRHLAMLKLVGALSGVGLDELVHRDAQRRTRRLLASGVGGVAATVTVLSLSGLALTARADAERRRTETTGLVEYMLTDMREALQRTGRLDQLAALNDGAMQYYRHQDLKRLSEAQLRQRAKLLQAMGEDDEKRGKLEAARESFEDAHRTTAALLAAKPNDPNRIFAHSQSEYWLGFINWRNGDGAAARKGFEAYAALAERLHRIDRNNREWLRETAYAESNLGMLALRLDGDEALAEHHFAAALVRFQAVEAGHPEDTDSRLDTADGYAWLADSQRLQGDYDAAANNRSIQRQLLESLAGSSPSDQKIRALLIYNELALARIDADRGRSEDALRRLKAGHAAALAVGKVDPANEDMIKAARMFELFQAKTILNNPRRPTAELSSLVGDCTRGVPAVTRDDEIRNFCLTIRTRMARASGDEAGARAAQSDLRSPANAEAYSKRWGLNFSQELIGR